MLTTRKDTHDYRWRRGRVARTAYSARILDQLCLPHFRSFL